MKLDHVLLSENYVTCYEMRVKYADDMLGGKVNECVCWTMDNVKRTWTKINYLNMNERCQR